MFARNGAFNWWVASACRNTWSYQGRDSLRPRLQHLGGARYRVQAPVTACQFCSCDRVAVWIDGRGPYLDGQELELAPGRHHVYAEGSRGGEVIVVLDQVDYLCTQAPAMDCPIRPFHLQGRLPNAVLWEAPDIAWTSAANRGDCLHPGCVRRCEAEPADLDYRLVLDDRGGEAMTFSEGEGRGEGGCGARWKMPQDLWDSLDPGFHQISLDARAHLAAGSASGTAGAAARSVRYGFWKAVPPASLTVPETWAPTEAMPYKVAGRLRCRGRCPQEAGAAAVVPAAGDDPRGLDSLERVLAGVSTNHLVHNLRQKVRVMDISGMRLHLEGPGASGILEPRYLPADPVVGGATPRYRDLLSDERGRKRQGDCTGRDRPMDGVAACPGTEHPLARLRWRAPTAPNVKWIQGVLADLPFAPRKETYIAVADVREIAGEPGRLRLGWQTRAPEFPGQSKIPNHRSIGVRLAPRESRRVVLEMPIAPPPPRPGTGGSPLMGRRKALWVMVLADYGDIVVEDLRIHRVEKGWFGPVRGARTGTPAGLYFDDADPLPSPVRSRTPLLSDEEMQRWISGISRIDLEATRFHRRVGAGPERPVLFALDDPHARIAMHSGPLPEDVLDVDPHGDSPAPGAAKRRVSVSVARNQVLAETAAVGILAGPRGLARMLPGWGRLEACGNTYEWEGWTSLAYLSQGTAWTETSYDDTPLVTNLYLTKGGEPWFDGWNSRFRVDEAMEIDLRLAPGAAGKLLLQFRLVEGREPGVCEVDLPLGPWVIPLRLRVMDVELPPEGNQWVQLAPTFLVDDDQDPANGCDFDRPGWRNPYGPPTDGCREDELDRSEPYMICQDDYEYLARRVRDHGHVGISVADACGRLAECTGPECPLDPLGFHAARCHPGDRFSRLVERTARAWQSVRPLPEGPGWQEAGGTDAPRPWIAAEQLPMAPPWPQCWNPEGSWSLLCPAEASGRSLLGTTTAARNFGGLRTIQEKGLGAMTFPANMDAIYRGGPDRAAAFAVILDSLHEMQAGMALTTFPPEGQRLFVEMTERAQVATDPSPLCHGRCDWDDVEGADYQDLERQLRWTQLYGTRWSDKGVPSYCPPRSGGVWWAWPQFMQEVQRQRRISDKRAGCSPDRCGPQCYCCEYEGPWSDACEEPGGSYVPGGPCKPGQDRPCRFDPAEKRPWCPRFDSMPEADEPALRSIDVVAHSIGQDWFLRVQEECRPGQPCRHLSPRRSDQALWNQTIWKSPFLSRFTAGFWTGASNLDAFHPYHLYFFPLRGRTSDWLSNFDLWAHNPVGFLHKVESRPPETGENCVGSCSGIIMTEAWEGLRTGIIDLAWWRALVRHRPESAACRRLRDEVLEGTRGLVFPYGVGRSEAPGLTTPPSIPAPINFWQGPGYPSEALSSRELVEVREAVIEALDCR